MLKQLFILKNRDKLLVLLYFTVLPLFFISVVLAADISYAEKAQQRKGLIIVTSERLTADNKTNTALFENSVVARAEDMTIYADKMLVHYDKDTGNITKIEAEGEIKLIKGMRVITSREATYYADGDKVIFTGEPRAVEGENVVTGRKMTYFLSEDRFLVEGSKVFLTRKKEQ